MKRREFLKISGLSAFTLSLNTLTISRAAIAEPQPYPYRTWEDIYRKVWIWDKVIKGTHAHTNCRANCAWDIYVKGNYSAMRF